MLVVLLYNKKNIKTLMCTCSCSKWGKSGKLATNLPSKEVAGIHIVFHLLIIINSYINIKC